MKNVLIFGIIFSKGVIITKKNVIKFIICAFIYFFNSFLVVYVNVCSIDNISIFKNKILPIQPLSGILITVCTLVLVYMTVSLKKPGFIFSLVCSISFLIFSIFIALFTQKYQSLVGLSQYVLAFVTVCLIYIFIHKNEKFQKNLYDIAYYDSLTQIPNRQFFNEFIDRQTTSTDVKKFALIFADFDNFKKINDTLGHKTGDQILKKVVNIWLAELTNNEKMFRIGGDEFAIIINDFKDNNELIKRINILSRSIENSIDVNDSTVFLSISFGISIYPDDATETASLMKYADIAMYNAKYDDSITCCFFNEEMYMARKRNVEVERILRMALSENGFSLVFQPQYYINPKSLRGFECLLRLKDSSVANIGPAEFIPIAEKSGLIIEIDKWVLQNSMMTFKPLLDKDPNLLLTINISVPHLIHPDFISDVANIIEKTDFPPKNLEFEITETVLIESISKAADIIVKIKEMGIAIALDDFGTGYASLRYLTKLPIDILKVDKCFTDILVDEQSRTNFIEAIISMGHVLNFQIVSEGVELQEQLDILKSLNCDCIQGYIWGRPSSIIDASKLVNQVELIHN